MKMPVLCSSAVAARLHFEDGENRRCVLRMIETFANSLIDLLNDDATRQTGCRTRFCGRRFVWGENVKIFRNDAETAIAEFKALRPIRSHDQGIPIIAGIFVFILNKTTGLIDA